MKKYILNSAVITTPGTYTYKHISVNEAKKWLAKKDWESTIGYLETAQALANLTGIPIAINRKQIKMNAGDEALVFRLTKRMQNVDQKGSVGIKFIMDNCEIGLLKKIA